MFYKLSLKPYYKKVLSDIYYYAILYNIMQYLCVLT